MKGFDPAFADPSAYILGITERIWEGRETGRLRHWYADDILIRSPAGLGRGNAPVIASSMATLAECPDRRLPGEDVIWVGDGDGGFLSSHRLLCWMTHERDGAYGPASGRHVRYRIIADCHARDGRVHEEWLARDQGAIARSLGTTARALAERQIEAGDTGFFTPADDLPGRYRPVVETRVPATIVADTWRRIFAEQALSAIRATYRDAATLIGPCDELHVGHEAIDAFFVGYLAAFPGAAFRVEHLIANVEPERPARVAMRWSLSGAHAGRGRFGEPSGRPVHVMGFTHAEIVDGRVANEWVVTDEVAIWKQILTPTGRSGRTRAGRRAHRTGG